MPERPTAPPAVIHSRRSTGYVLLGFLATFMPMPFNIVAIVPLVAAVVESVLTLRAMREAKAPRATRQWTGVSLAVTVMLIAMVGVPYLFWGATSSYQKCMDGANTNIAQASCKNSFADTNLLHSYLGGS
ncbi:hypothetical protein [Leekyejoonella antrihumi]|uniref:Uncharacterized protein n=1 Tax=Leekyejoonella antrihumi TaxID=1660198 RepID=A0A563E0L9_9MICO|nr:hypothetical protein [Leekyejoonella antrihumi]TWP35935.1 hypothetical protein FGL98_11935 [Leekyejoonella antrihumi]